jgi:hypothetical protein
VGRDVKRVLGAQLEAAFHDPARFDVGVELVDRNAAMGCEHLERFPDCGQVAADDLNVDLPRPHSHLGMFRPGAPRTESILASCGT